MKGPLRRIRSSRRPPDPSQQESQPTIVAPPQAPPAAPLPAGLAPEDVAPTRPSFRDRGRLRRRLRYLRRVRELGFRDLGGLAFDLHRFARRNDELVLGKLAALDAVDRELRAIERVLDERRDIIELREPGVAACPRCGALHGSDARFCPQCGTQFSGPLAMVEVGGELGASGIGVGGTVSQSVDPAQEALPLSVTEQGTTPVSGALAGNPPPPAPPEPGPEPQPEPLPQPTES
jgi:ribosomal protein L40E